MIKRVISFRDQSLAALTKSHIAWPRPALKQVIRPYYAIPIFSISPPRGIDRRRHLVSGPRCCPRLTSETKEYAKLPSLAFNATLDGILH